MSKAKYRRTFFRLTIIIYLCLHGNQKFQIVHRINVLKFFWCVTSCLYDLVIFSYFFTNIPNIVSYDFYLKIT